MTKFATVFFIISILLSSPLHAASSPSRTVTNFYQWLIQHNVSGLPNEEELVLLKKFLSADLIYLLHASLAAEERCAVLTPAGLKPPLFEGNLFVDNYEGLTKVKNLSEHKLRDKTIITAQLEYTNPHSTADIISWSDTLTVKLENKLWVISELSSIRDKRKLGRVLKSYISKRECGI